MKLLATIIIGISLSMDAFSLALSIGFILKRKRNRFFLALIVGTYHFFMPILGHFLGSKFIEILNLNTNLFSGIVFLYIVIQMIKEYKNEEESNYNFNILGMNIFALGVSLDSFGIGCTLVDSEVILSGLVFSFMSFTFTFLGLTLSQKLSLVFGKYATMLGILIMLAMSILNFLKFAIF